MILLLCQRKRGDTVTEDEAIKKLIAWVNQQIGTHEGPDNWNKYADSPDMTKLYGWNVQNQPWCDVFVDAAFISCFGFDAGSAMTYQYAGCNGAACRYSAEYYQKHGAWYKEPQVGDQVFFYSGASIGHTGVVTQVGMGAITTVEGNSSDAVTRRSYTIGSPAIAGYGRPNWSLAGRDIIVPTTPVDEDSPDEPVEPLRPSFLYHKHTYKVALNLLKLGDYGPLVMAVQAVLNAHGFDCKVDGEFGSETEEAVERFQSQNRLTVDGEVGGQTYQKLFYYGG